MLNENCLIWYRENFLRQDETGDFDMGSRYDALNKCFEIVYRMDKFSNDYSFSKLLDIAWTNGIIEFNFIDFYEKFKTEKKERLKVSPEAIRARENLKKVYLKQKKLREEGL